MNENGGTQPSSAPAVPETGRATPVMDVVARRPAEAPVERPALAAPPSEILSQIQPREVPITPPKESVRDIVAAIQPAADKPPTISSSLDQQLAEPPQETDGPEALLQDHPPVSPHKTKKPKPAKPVKPAKSNAGVTGPIIATVIIVVVLAGLAVYAYLQSQHQSAFPQTPTNSSNL